jgi:hypothetical protein
MIDHSTMRLGRKAIRRDHRTLLLASYLTPSLPAAPAAHAWSSKVASWPMYANDRLGDCTAAAAGHLVSAWTANAFTEYDMPESDVVAFYEDSTGYDPADPETDQGGIEIDVLNSWRSAGCGGHKIGAYVSVSPTSKTLTRDGIYLFGGLYLGIALPLSAQKQRVWDVPHGGPFGLGAPGSWGGHAVPAVDYDGRGITVVTWGGLKRMTWNFYRTYCDEAYAILSPDFVTGARPAPNGFDLTALQEDLAKL